MPTNKSSEINSNINIEIDILNQIKLSLKKEHSYEAYILAWTSIEQFMLPRLIRYIAKDLKLFEPKNMEEIRIQQLIQIYYYLSHDNELTEELNKGRHLRNELIHKLYKKGSWSEIESLASKNMRDNIKKLLLLFRNRLNDKSLIPSLRLYINGWNDALKEVEKVI